MARTGTKRIKKVLEKIWKDRRIADPNRIVGWNITEHPMDGTGYLYDLFHGLNVYFKSGKKL